MGQVVQIQFSDKMMPFSTFIGAIRNVVREEVANAVGINDSISQNKAFRKYGKARVLHWLKDGLVQPSKTRGKLLYKVSELEACKMRIQDYL